MKLLLDENTFGITQESLKRLRNELARRIDHNIEVHQIQTDAICCGFLILDYPTNEASFSGDGFRTDRCGEGGAGYNTAEVLFQIFGIRALEYKEIEYFQTGTLYEAEQKLKKYIIELIQESERLVENVVCSTKRPEYIRR